MLEGCCSTDITTVLPPCDSVVTFVSVPLLSWPDNCSFEELTCVVLSTTWLEDCDWMTVWSLSASFVNMTTDSVLVIVVVVGGFVSDADGLASPSKHIYKQ